MVDVYRQNPSLGDPNTIEQQLSENARELDALNEDLHKYQVRWKLLGGLVCLVWVRANINTFFLLCANHLYGPSCHEWE